MISFLESWMMERSIWNSLKFSLSFSFLVTELREFSQNKTVLQQNIKKDSIYNKRIIREHMFENKLQSHSIEIANEMRKLVRAARIRYAVYLED